MDVVRPPRILVVGEGMLELSSDGGVWRLGYGGDTLNTAVHLVRAGFDVAYLTALGTDPFSADLRSAWAAEGLDTGLVLADPERQPGLYAIRTDESGERSFFYWRGESAARRLFELAPGSELAEHARAADLVIFSLISLAILDAGGQARLLDLAAHVRAGGGRIAFDGNYRPRLWPDASAARAARDAALGACDFGLPTLEDERLVSGSANARSVADAWRAAGVPEVVVKLGSAGCLVEGEVHPPPQRVDPVDTSGAGDAFNAGYLGARLLGRTPGEAAEAAQRLAGWVVSRPGAIPPRDDGAPYLGFSVEGGHPGGSQDR